MKAVRDCFRKVFIAHLADMSSGILVATLLNFMLLVFAPADIYFTNVDEFWFDIFKVFPLLLAQFLFFEICNIIFFLILVNISTKIYHIFVFVEFAVFIILYVHGTFLLSGVAVFSGDVEMTFTPAQYAGSVITVVIVTGAIIALIKIFHTDKALRIVKITSLFLLIVLAVSGISEGLLYGGFQKKTDYAVTDEALWEYSGDENFIIVVLDAVGSDGFVQALAEYNDSNNTDLFKDFTFYANSCGKYPFTRFAVLQMLTGETFTNQAPYETFTRQSFSESPLFNELKDRGYDIGVYMSELLKFYKINDDTLQDFTNVIEIPSAFNSYRRLYISTDSMVFYRYLPYFMKDLIDTGRIDFDSLRESENDTDLYDDKNRAFYDSISDSTVSITDQKKFKYIHLLGGHRNTELAKYIYDRNLNEYDGEFSYSAMIEQQIGCCVMLEGYFDFLKENGLYDNSVIIVMADHGERIDDKNEYNTLEYACNPILFVKGMGETSDAGHVSKYPVSYDDLGDVYAALLKGAAGTELFDEDELSDRPRYYWRYSYSNAIYAEEENMREYEIKGDVSNPASASYEKTGTEYSVCINQK